MPFNIIWILWLAVFKWRILEMGTKQISAEICHHGGIKNISIPPSSYIKHFHLKSYASQLGNPFTTLHWHPTRKHISFSNRLPSIRTVRHRGVFDKRRAIRSAVKKIKEQDSIIFLMDLHILVPDTIIQLVRKVRFHYFENIGKVWT